MLPKEAGEQHWNLIAPSAATRVTTVETQTASTTASHNDQGRSSREQPNCYHYPFPVHHATEQVSYPLHPAIFLAQ